MMINYLKIAVRNMLHNKVFSLINVAGLAVGTGTFLLIFLYCWHALHYDNFYSDQHRLFRVIQRDGRTGLYDGFISWGLAKQLRDGTETDWNVVRLSKWKYWVAASEVAFKEDIYFADENFFDVFNFPLAKGSPEKALQLKNSIVLSKGLAIKLFGGEDAVGKTIRVNTKMDFIVTGILDEIPANTIFQVNAMIPLQNVNDLFYEGADSGWHDRGASVFIKTQNSDENHITSLLNQIYGQHVPEKNKEDLTFRPQKLSHIYLNPDGYDFGDLEYSMYKTNSYLYIMILLSIGGLILLLAIVNYFNLSTSIFATRIKEIGIRKVSGASQLQLRLQFISEALVTVFLAVVAGIVIFQLVLPFFEQLTEEKVILSALGNTYVIGAALILFTLITGVLSGAYPAFYLTSKRIARAQQNFRLGVSEKELLRNGLVVFQIVTSMVLMICLTIVSTQIDFMKSADKGFDQDRVITIPIDMANTGDLAVNAPVLVTQLSWHADIENVSLHQASMGRYIKNEFSTYPESTNEQITSAVTYVDEQYMDIYHIKMVAGNNFDIYPDSVREQKILLNESAAKSYGWTPGQAIHKTVRLHAKQGPALEVIGVVGDFHFQSLEHRIRPIVFQYTARPYHIEYISIRINSDHLRQTIALIEDEWKMVMKGFPFEYYFTEDDYKENYAGEEKQRQSILAASILAIFIASLGLFGLASYTVLQRTKEIGIRKVLGASISNILLLLSKKNLVLLLTGFAIASTAAYFLMEQWLSQFAFRVDLQWWMFVLPGVLVATIAILSVSSHSLKASLANPVDSLRNE